MKIELIQLPFQPHALEPVLSRQTINLHYGKHLQTYINNLNNLIIGTKYEKLDLESIIKDSEGAIYNNAGQIYNHNLYFQSITPKVGGEPEDKLAEAINKEWGSFENFKKEFSTAAISLFGSGWAFLVKDAEGKLSITKESNAGCPITRGLTPLLTFDVWEHAYYVDYQNRRTDYVASLWNIVDWEVVSKRY